MSTFVEADHPRAGGRFVEKAGAEPDMADLNAISMADAETYAWAEGAALAGKVLEQCPDAAYFTGRLDEPDRDGSRVWVIDAAYREDGTGVLFDEDIEAPRVVGMVAQNVRSSDRSLPVASFRVADLAAGEATPDDNSALIVEVGQLQPGHVFYASGWKLTVGHDGIIRDEAGDETGYDPEELVMVRTAQA